MSQTQKLVGIATVVGFVGDALLQGLVAHGFGGPTGWGLKEYFQQHGRAEAMFTAAGMMGLSFVIYLALNLPLTIPALAIYATILDLIFRFTNLFPSLSGYYKQLNVFESICWAIIPILLPYFIYK